MSARLDGKVGLVTGASRGVGKGIALGLGEAGAEVWVTARTASTPASAGPTSGAAATLAPGSLEDTVREVEAAGGRAVAVARRSGSVLVAAALGREYGFTDVDGRSPEPLSLDRV